MQLTKWLVAANENSPPQVLICPIQWCPPRVIPCLASYFGGFPGENDRNKSFWDKLYIRNVISDRNQSEIRTHEEESNGLYKCPHYEYVVRPPPV